MIGVTLWRRLIGAWRNRCQTRASRPRVNASQRERIRVAAEQSVTSSAVLVEKADHRAEASRRLSETVKGALDLVKPPEKPKNARHHR